MKTRFFFLLLTAMLLSVGAFAQSNETLKGDVNGDGEIDIADAVCVVNYIVGNPTPTFVALAADANGDGDIDIADAVTIVNYIVGNPSSLSTQTTYYWYVGKDETLLGKNGTSYNLDLSNFNNYKVSSIDDIYSDSQYVGDVDNNVYVLCPTEWINQFKLTDLDNNELIFIDKTSHITSGVTGYSILRGAAKTTDTSIKIIRI